MPSRFSLRSIFLGLASGVIAGVVCLILAYFVGAIVVAISLRDLLATLLTAFTVLPLMLIFVGIPVTLTLVLMTATPLGIAAAIRGRPFGLLPGALLGFACSELVLSVIVPLVMPPQPGDFIHIVSNPYLSASYGLALGGITSLIFRRLDRRQK